MAVAGLVLTLSVAQAAEKTECAASYTRTACPGQEAVSAAAKCNSCKWNH